ncbi:MAG TPA: glycosyltransferase family 4 protein [Nitrospirales bacterium]|nr:glycosyltransferase family 4 protein [Nitrospirales bacterium]
MKSSMAGVRPWDVAWSIPRSDAASGRCGTAVLALIDTREVSGPCRGLYQLVTLAAPHGVHVTVGMFARPGSRLPAVEETRRRGLPLVVLSQRRRYDASLVGQAWRVVHRERIDILQSHGYKPALVAWCLKRLLGMPWVAFSHGYTSENRRIALYNRLDRWLMRRADRVVVMSDAMATMFAGAGIAPARMRVIHNALDPDEYDAAADGAPLRAECNAGPDDVLLGVIGRFSTEKGQAIFLRALSSVVASKIRVKAALIGDGLDAERLRQLTADLKLQDYVSFTGYRLDMSAVYAALDLVVIPSLSEGLPNVLLEAMYHRKPVVATRVGAIPDVLAGELGRWIVPPGDGAALARAIGDAVGDERARDVLGTAGRRVVQERFSPEQRVERIVDVYRDVLNHAGD